MLYNYRLLADQISARLNPEKLSFDKSFNEELGSIQYQDANLFVLLAMKGVDDTYTKKSIEAGDMVIKHLKETLVDVDYEYQGSVMTNTHIMGYSDIDLLCVSSRFYNRDMYSVDRYLNDLNLRRQLTESQLVRLEREKSYNLYKGNSTSDLQEIRFYIEASMSTHYSSCDISNPMAVKIVNKNLNRKVDIVTASWYSDIQSIANGEKKGVQVFNNETKSLEPADFPFTSIDRINARDYETGGRLKKMIRFLKNVKNFSSGKIDLNSFEINGICYAIEPSKYQGKHYSDLVSVVLQQLYKITTDLSYTDSLFSVDGREYLFKEKPDKVKAVEQLRLEVNQINNDMSKILQS